MKTRTAWVLLIVCVLGCGVAGEAGGQDKWPSRPVSIIVPAPPGGGTDVFARQLGELADPILKQKFLIENKPGGGGTVGTALITQARPDGYSLAAVWSSPITASPHSLQVPYTPESYTPLLYLGSSAYVVCAAPSFPAANAKEWIAHLRDNPGKYTYGNEGVGGTLQLGLERIFGHLGVKARPVPFSGGGETAKNFLGGHVTFYGGAIPTILPHVQAGKAKCLLVTSADANPALPGVQNVRDLGIPELEIQIWWGLIGPKGLSAERTAEIERGLRQAADSDKMREAMVRQGAILNLKGAAEFSKLIRTEYASLAEVAKAIGLQKRTQ